MRARFSIPRTRKSATVAVIAAALVLLCAGSYITYRRHQVVRLGYELSDALAKRRKLEEEERRLRLEASVLTNPERIERLARGMGMVKPSPEQYRDARPSALAAAEAR